MLNIHAIEAAMLKLGLNGTALAEACGVSKEATSNWLKGESIPRPSKLTRLADTLGLPVESLLQIAEPTQPVFAYRTRLNKPVTGPLREAAEDQGRHLEQLLPFVEVDSEFEPPLLKNPSLEEERIRKAANAVRASIGLGHMDVLSNEQLENLFRTFGAILVPVLWGLNKEKHENALTVYLPESKTSWVVFNLGCKLDDYKYWLAHEYGHCLTLHGLSEEDGEIFAEKFAQHLVFPDEVAHQCLERIRANGTGIQVVKDYAERFGISVITVLRAVDRLSEQLFGAKTGLGVPRFYASWKISREGTPSMAYEVFGTDAPSSRDYVEKTEARYKTKVFEALQNFQVTEGGRNPAFIANTLKIGLGDAISHSLYLWERQC
ncbi:ImmA/IrrE family metallo-endopeptidase [Chromobacterium phragmitis]|uniref:helix-turn-helix domain-containing protein n=1 Tax=Chromobacterium amazonense TaxID=1382803 RepID=UPI0021B6EE17|nr:XRE family transcriptional regulator [Chromobacterium amazonense]MBM2886490.1 ImmA/IrrE family metallo-endopeptidase [Chromobacterium amazonense]MDE1713590.1 XRE family transcriptional regulator [Chromobacterium amazonense]